MHRSESSFRVPTPEDLLVARRVLREFHLRTPLFYSAALSHRYGGCVQVKYENFSYIRSFKARGAIFCLSRLTPEERGAGAVTASTGNHGQGVAYAGTLFGVATKIVVPDGTPGIKCDAIRALGGELVFFGKNFNEAAGHARGLAADTGAVYIDDGANYAIMAGAATIGWEIMEELPDASVLVAAVGGGNLIAGIALVAKMLKPGIRIVGVQSEAAPAVARSWAAGHVIECESNTAAEGIDSSSPGELAFEVIKNKVDDMHLVTESAIRRAILTVLQTTGQIAEGAGAAPFAALDDFGPAWRDEKVALVLSGGNLMPAYLHSLLNEAARTGAFPSGSPQHLAPHP
jgi:threonine dehydratase